MRKASFAAATTLLALAFADAAFAHASLSPPVAKSKVLQQFTLSVPTEKEGVTTTEIELTVPAGFAIDSFEPETGWKRSEQATGSGEEKTIQKVTWTGGNVPTDEDAVFRFNGSLASSKSYKATVRQTYSDGSVVDWTGPESSDTRHRSWRGSPRSAARPRRWRSWHSCSEGSASCSGSSASPPGGGRSHETGLAARARGGGGARAARRRVGARGVAAHRSRGQPDGRRRAARGAAH